MVTQITRSQPPAILESTTASPPTLPTFDWEVGYKEIYNPKTGRYEQQSLTLLEVLYPIEEDVGVVKMSQSLLHDLWTNWLKVMLQTYLGQGWLVLNDVLVQWAEKRAPTKSPDVTVIPGAKFPANRKSYRVGPDGPLPVFVLEVTSEDTRDTDLHEKRLVYAAVGVKEYLIIDILTPETASWQLLGYRLENQPHYRELTPDAEGGLTFETVGLRFVGIGRERIEVFDVVTGERLLTPPELKVHAERETAARVEAEARIVALEARLRELEDASE